jgi:hypothetical protein
MPSCPGNLLGQQDLYSDCYLHPPRNCVAWLQSLALVPVQVVLLWVQGYVAVPLHAEC